MKKMSKQFQWKKKTKFFFSEIKKKTISIENK